MVATPKPGAYDPMAALVDRITALEMTVKNATNKTLNSASITTGVSSGFDVYASGVDKLHVGPDQTIMRDKAGNVVISDDAVAGWGMTQPNVTYQFVPNLYQMNSQLGGIYISQSSSYPTGAQVILAGQQIINHPRLHWSYTGIGLNGSNTTAATFNFWATAQIIGSSSIIIDGPHSLSAAAPLGQGLLNWSFVYDWPSDIFGQIVLLEVWGQGMTGQAGVFNGFQASITYCYGSGRS